MRCQCCTTRTTPCLSVRSNVRRQDPESSGFNIWRSFSHNPWQWGSRSLFVSWDLLCQLQFRSHHLQQRATQAVPVRRVPRITQCLSRPTFASNNSILGKTQNCSCSMMMTNEDSLSHAACKCTDTTFSKFAEPNFLSRLRHWLSPNSTRSPYFTRFSVFADPHLVHGLRCKKRPSQLSSGLSTAMRTLLWSVYCRISKWFCRKPRSLMKPRRNEMEYAVRPFRSQQVAPVWPYYLLSRQIRVGNVSAFSCVKKP